MSDLPLIYEKDYARKRALITFNRPERMNAMSPDLIALLGEATEDFNNDPDLWVAIITGAGERAFCAGADLSSTIPAAGGGDAERAAQGLRHAQSAPRLQAGPLRGQRLLHRRRSRVHARHRHPRRRRACRVRSPGGSLGNRASGRLAHPPAAPDSLGLGNGDPAHGPSAERPRGAPLRPDQPRRPRLISCSPPPTRSPT